MTINVFKVMGMVGMLAAELSMIAADGKITVEEAFQLVKKICDQLGLDFDEAGFNLNK